MVFPPLLQPEHAQIRDMSDKIYPILFAKCMWGRQQLKLKLLLCPLVQDTAAKWTKKVILH